jgi:hypothetical protein
MPSTGILITGDLRSAEMVELADTPSDPIALAILHKLLIINLLPFASITSENDAQIGQQTPVSLGCRQSVQNPVQFMAGPESAVWRRSREIGLGHKDDTTRRGRSLPNPSCLGS